MVQENQQLDFKIKLPVKIVNQELERTGAIPLPYFLHTQIHPGKQKPSLMGRHDESRMWWYTQPQLMAWQVCGMMRLLRIVWAGMRKIRNKSKSLSCGFFFLDLCLLFRYGACMGDSMFASGMWQVWGKSLSHQTSLGA